MELSMIVEITSLTPRVTLSAPAIAAQTCPPSMATTRISGTWRTAGRSTLAPTQAAISAAIVYWPSTPMLNSPILNAMANATPER